MNSTLAPARSARRSRKTAPDSRATGPQLSWIHDGVRYRVTVWPEVASLREIAPDEWVATELSEEACASAALGVTSRQWASYLEFVPAAVRDLLETFQFGRMAALQVISRCPSLLPALTNVPAITPFLHAHLALRGGDTPRWMEMAAIFEREEIFGLLQWLGLPASRQTVEILQHIADPDLPRRLLEPLRAALWEPEAIWELSHAPTLTDESLARACDALAA